MVKYLRLAKRASDASRATEAMKIESIIALVGMITTNCIVNTLPLNLVELATPPNSVVMYSRHLTYFNDIIFSLIPVIMPPSLAIPFFLISQNIVFFFMSAKYFQMVHFPIPLTTVTKAICLTLLKDFVLYKLAGADYSNAISLHAFSLLTEPSLQDVDDSDYWSVVHSYTDCYIVLAVQKETVSSTNNTLMTTSVYLVFILILPYWMTANNLRIIRKVCESQVDLDEIVPDAVSALAFPISFPTNNSGSIGISGLHLCNDCAKLSSFLSHQYGTTINVIPFC